MFKCKGCGVCCEFFCLRQSVDKVGKEWLEARGCVIKQGLIMIPLRCPHLNAKRECDIWKNRPLICKKYLCVNDKTIFKPIRLA